MTPLVEHNKKLELDSNKLNNKMNKLEHNKLSLIPLYRQVPPHSSPLMAASLRLHNIPHVH